MRQRAAIAALAAVIAVGLVVIVVTVNRNSMQRSGQEARDRNETTLPPLDQPSNTEPSSSPPPVKMAAPSHQGPQPSKAPREQETERDAHASRAAYPHAPNMVLALTDKETGIKIAVAQNGRHLFATDAAGKELWRIDVINATGGPVVGSPVVRHISFRSKGKILAVMGKHAYAEVDLNAGKVKFLGAD